MESNDTKASEVTSSLLKLQNDRPPSIWFSKRFLVAFLLFSGFCLYSLELVLGAMAIVEMTSSKQIIEGNQTITRPAEFQWDSITSGTILNMFWYGVLLSPVGGMISQKFGGSTTVGITKMISGLLTLLTPMSLHVHLNLFMVLRGLVGVFEGFFNASNTDVFARWIPKKERSVFMSFIMNGIYAGIAFAYLLCGFIAYYFGWQMMFYTTGSLTLAWSIIWLIFIPNEPSNDKLISKRELVHILEGTGEVSTTKGTYPYKDIFKSPPFWAISMGKMAFGWTSTFISVCLPLYISDRVHSNIRDVGFFSSVPQLFNIIFIPVAGTLMSYVQNHTGLKLTQIHKTAVSAGIITGAILFAVITVVEDLVITSICFVMITVLISYNRIVLELITVNMAPNHSGLVSGLSLCFQTIGLVSTETLLSLIVQNHKMEEWNICFYASTGFLAICALVFITCGSSEPQEWSLKDSKINGNFEVQNKIYPKYRVWNLFITEK